MGVLCGLAYQSLPLGLLNQLGALSADGILIRPAELPNKLLLDISGLRDSSPLAKPALAIPVTMHWLPLLAKSALVTRQIPNLL